MLLLSWLLCPNLDWLLPAAHQHPDGIACRYEQWPEHRAMLPGFVLPDAWPHEHPDDELCRWAVILDLDNAFPW